MKQRYIVKILVIGFIFILFLSLMHIGNSDGFYEKQFYKNKESFQNLQTELTRITDSIYSHHPKDGILRSGSKKRTSFDVETLSQFTALDFDFIKSQRIKYVYHSSDSSVKIFPKSSLELHPIVKIFRKHKYYEYFVCGEPTMIVSTLDSAGYYEKEYESGVIHRELSDGWYLAYRWNAYQQ